jgi:hypothetical protein
VTGSLNAAQGLPGRGSRRRTSPARTVLGRAGRMHINLDDGQVSVGGDTHTIVRGPRP